ncbi:hypothetical protein BJ546DRAFT_157808 [Cryomyces antarcticus]
MSTTGHYADDSDADSYSAELSPADGYFSQRVHPQEPYMDTPSSSSDSSKTRGAADESQSSSVAHVSSPRETATSSAWSDEGTALLAAGPPPAYWAGNANTPSGLSVRGDGHREEADSPTRSLDDYEQSSSGYGTTLLTPASTPFTRSNAPQSMRSFQKFDDPVGGMWRQDSWRARARRCVQPARTLQLFLVIVGILGLVWILKVARPNHEVGAGSNSCLETSFVHSVLEKTRRTCALQCYTRSCSERTGLHSRLSCYDQFLYLKTQHFPI